MQNFLSLAQAEAAIEALTGEETILIQGEHGIGKTQLFRNLAKKPAYADHLFIEPIDCSQLSDGSIFMPDIDREAGVSRELPNERLGVSKLNRHGVAGSRPIMLCFDEVGKTTRYMHNILAPLIYEGRVGDYYFPKGSLIMCATNLTIEGLGDVIQEHIMDRLTPINVRKSTAEEYVQYAQGAGVHPMVIAYVASYPQVMESFMDYEPGGIHHGKDLSRTNGRIYNPRKKGGKYATPRSINRMGTILTAHETKGKTDEFTLEMLLAGAVGTLVAAEFMSFRALGESNCSIARVLHDPLTAPVSDNKMAQMQQAMKLLSVIDNRTDAQLACAYVRRMAREVQCMFVNGVTGSNRKAIYLTLAVYLQMQNETKMML